MPYKTPYVSYLEALASCSTRQYVTWLSCTTLVGTTIIDITKYSEAELGGQRLGKAVKKDPKVEKEPEQWETKIELLRETDKDEIPAGFPIGGDDQGFMEEGDVKDHFPDLPSADELTNVVLDAPAGHTRRKVK